MTFSSGALRYPEGYVRRTRLLRILICIRDHPTAIVKRQHCAGKY